jgi:hypothetical protein
MAASELYVRRKQSVEPNLLSPKMSHKRLPPLIFKPKEPVVASKNLSMLEKPVVDHLDDHLLE